MDFKTPPVTAEQIADFLQCCLDILRQLHTCKIQQHGLALLFEDIIRGMHADAEQYVNLQKIMLPEAVLLDIKIRDVLASPEGQYVMAYLPLRYCRLETVLWLIRKHRSHPFPDIRTAFRAADRSPALWWHKIRESSVNRKLRLRVVGVMETWLEDHPSSPTLP